jgi:hypothetical protein
VHVHLPLKPEVVDAVLAVSGQNERTFCSRNGLPKSCVADWQRTLGKLFRIAGVEHGHARRFRDTFPLAYTVTAWSPPLEDVSATVKRSSRK